LGINLKEDIKLEKSSLLEIRWHGRGGQGTKTASLLLAEVAFETGKFIQGFPEYGPERMGAPITSYNRISSSKIRIHSNIYEPDYVVVVDETLLRDIDVTSGLKPDGGIIINTEKSPTEIRPLLKGYSGRIYTLDARKISLDALGQYYPNTPMLGGVVRVIKLMEERVFLKAMEKLFNQKFASKSKVIQGNLKALEMALKEVKE